MSCWMQFKKSSITATENITKGFPVAKDWEPSPTGGRKENTMGMRADLIKEMSKAIRKRLYDDDYYCKDVETHKFDRYISDNPDNSKALEDAMTNKGITLVVAPTGSGKSTTLASVAKEVVKKDKNCRVYIALPTLCTTSQVGNIPDVWKMVGGNRFNPHKQIAATTYEKLADVQEYIRIQKALGRKERYVLIIDECHFMVTQHKFREWAIKGIITSIEKNFYDSTILLTATPAPMPLFRCDKCIEFESDTYRPAMDRIEIEFVDDVIEYIKGIDVDNCFPFIRLNDKKIISNLVDKYLPFYAPLTSDNKDSDIYKSIVEQETINNSSCQGILTTSVSEVGLNVTSYPSNMQMIAGFPGSNMSVDSIEQFFNRARRTNTSHIECAKVVLPRPKENEAYLLDQHGNKVCEFHDIVLEDDKVTIKDTSQMDGLACGKYRMELDLYGGKRIRDLYIQSLEDISECVYCKDSQPVSFYGVGFMSFISIFDWNRKRANAVKNTLQLYVSAFEKIRDEKRISENLSDDEMEGLELNDNKLIEIMTHAGIDAQNDLKDCLVYEDGKVEVDYRLLYMVSYKRYQEQYLYHADKLKEELEKRMKVKVSFVETATAKGKKDYNRNDLWEGIEDVRQGIVCDGNYYNAIVKREKNKYTSDVFRNGDICTIREREYLIELMKDLEKRHMSGGSILRVMVSSKSKSKVTKFKNAYHQIALNQMLEKFDGMNVKDIPLYNKGINDTLQVAIYCLLKQKKLATCKVTDALAKEVIAFYKKSYPSEVKAFEAKKEKNRIKEILRLMRKMYKKKDDDYIFCELRTDEVDIFKIEDSDYK